MMKALVPASLILGLLVSAQSAEAFNWSKVPSGVKLPTTPGVVTVNADANLWLVSNEPYNADGNRIYSAPWAGAPLTAKNQGAVQIAMSYSGPAGMPWVITANGHVKRWDANLQTFVADLPHMADVCVTSIAPRTPTTAYAISCDPPVDFYGNRNPLYFNGTAWSYITNVAGVMVSTDDSLAAWLGNGAGTAYYAFPGYGTNAIWNLASSPIPGTYLAGGFYDGLAGGGPAHVTALALGADGNLYAWASTYWQFLGTPPPSVTFVQVARFTRGWGYLAIDSTGDLWRATSI